MAARSPRWMIFITVGLVHFRRVQTASMGGIGWCLGTGRRLQI